MFGLGMGEIVVLVVIAVVLFGTNDLPKTLRKVAKGVGEFKKVANDAQRSWTEVRDDVTRTIMAADLEDTMRRAVSDPIKPAEVAAESAHNADQAHNAALAQSVEHAQGDPAHGAEHMPPIEIHTADSLAQPDSASAAPAPLPVAKPAENAVVRSPEGPHVDHHHDHHEERGTEPDALAALPSGERKSV